MFLKQAVTRLAASSGFFALGRSLTRSSLRIFTYHGVEKCDDLILNFDRLQVNPALFEKQVAWIGSRYRVISASEMLDCIHSGSNWPDRAALITFDDGYLNNLEIAAPILKHQGVPAVVFVTTGFVEGSVLPWWYEVRRQHFRPLGTRPRPDAGRATSNKEQLAQWIIKERELAGKTRAEQEAYLREVDLAVPARCAVYAESGWQPKFMKPEDLAKLKDFDIEIGLHGHRHLACGVEPEEMIMADLITCRQKLKEWDVQPLPIFAYPYGSLPPTPQALGIQAGLTTIMGINGPGFDPLFLKRYDVNGGRTVANLAAISSGCRTIPAAQA